MTPRRAVAAALILLFTSLFGVAQPNPEPVAANGSVFGAFRAAYPNSSSPAASCQLCHMKTTGGDGWNAYGWSIRQGIEDNNLEIAAAIAAIEALDADGNGSSNLDEINAGRLPGWTLGAVNTVYFKDGTTMENQLPPNPGVALDIGVAITNPITAPITSTEGMTVALRTLADGLLSPLVGTSTATLPDHLFVVDQPGQVYQISLNSGEKSIFLDVSGDLVDLGAFGQFDERGLLGFAFHPSYSTNGLVYTYQSEPVQGTPTFTTTVPLSETANHQSVVAEWTVTDPTNPASVADPSTKRVLMRIDEPQFNHNGGQLAFGPDNMLYIAVGDGGGADDADGQQFIDGPISGHGTTGNGRDATNPLGTILRIDPTGTDSANGQYGIPTDNPFVAEDDERLNEIYAYGFRNVFRFSFDSQTGDLYAADVGQNDIEELDIVVSGGNYGWNYKEGSFFFDTNGNDDGFVTADPGGLPTDLLDPIAEYDHDEGLSIIGGFVYSGTQIANLNGTYVFGDWSLDFSSPPGRLFHLDDENNIHEFQLTNRATLGMFLNGFGQDTNGEIYVLGNRTGVPFPDEDGNRTGVVLKLVAPSPFAEKLTGDFSNDRAAPEAFTLEAGDNIVTATSVQGDPEYYALTIPEGMELDSIVLESYESTVQRSFIAIQSGLAFTEAPTETVRSNLLGYLVYGPEAGHIGSNILDDMGIADEAIGFTGPLSSGTYTIWSQETSAESATYSFNFVVKSANRIYIPSLINP